MTTAGLGVLALVAGTAGGIVALTGDDTRVVTAVGQAAPVVELPAPEVPVRPPTGDAGLGDGAVGHAAAAKEADDTRAAPGEADRTATRPPRRPPGDRGRIGGAAVVPGTAVSGAGGAAVVPGRPPAVAAPGSPKVRVVRVSRTGVIPFRTTRVRDASLPAGSRKIRSPGAPGKRLLRYAFTYTGNRVTSRRLLGSTVTRSPKDRVIAVGTRKHSDHRDDGRPSGDEPGADEPSGDEPGADEPDFDEPDFDEPDFDEPDGDEPDGEPGTDDSDSDGDGEQECRLLDACVWLGRETGCDGSSDGDGLLDPADIDEMDLILPCEDEDEDEDWDDGWDDGEETVRERE